MNIIEAIKSGKRFKLPYHDYYMETKDGKIIYRDGGDICHAYGAYSLDLISNDWEIEEEKVELTREQVAEALLDAAKFCDVLTHKIWIDRKLKILGFK